MLLLRRIIHVLLALFLLSACDEAANPGVEKSDSGANNEVEGKTGGADAAEDRVGLVAGVKVEEKSIDNIKTFFRVVADDGGPEEGFSGLPKVKDGCLFLFDVEEKVEYLLVWPSGKDAEAKTAITNALSDSPIEMTVGGDDVSLDEFKKKTSDHPTKCKYDAVYFAYHL